LLILWSHISFQRDEDNDAVEDFEDYREWTEKHMEAAGCLPHPAMTALTPPQRDQAGNCDVNTRGPSGYTPLMIASFCGARNRRSLPDSDSTGSTDIEDSSATVVSELIYQGAAVNTTTDRTGNKNEIKMYIE